MGVTTKSGVSRVARRIIEISSKKVEIKYPAQFKALGRLEDAGSSGDSEVSKAKVHDKNEDQDLVHGLEMAKKKVVEVHKKAYLLGIALAKRAKIDEPVFAKPSKAFDDLIKVFDGFNVNLEVALAEATHANEGVLGCS